MRHDLRGQFQFCITTAANTSPHAARVGANKVSLKFSTFAKWIFRIYGTFNRKLKKFSWTHCCENTKTSIFRCTLPTAMWEGVRKGGEQISLATPPGSAHPHPIPHPNTHPYPYSVHPSPSHRLLVIIVGFHCVKYLK